MEKNKRNCLGTRTWIWIVPQLFSGHAKINVRWLILKGKMLLNQIMLKKIWLHPPIKGSHNRALSICTFVSNTFFVSFDCMAALDVKHRPILKVNLVKPSLVRCRMQKLIINASFTSIIDTKRSTCVWPQHFLDMKDFVKHVLCAIQPFVGFLIHFHAICNFWKNVFSCVGMWWHETIFLWERTWWWNGWTCNSWSSIWSTYAWFNISKEFCAPLEHNKSVFPWFFIFFLHIFLTWWWCTTHLLPRQPKVFK